MTSLASKARPYFGAVVLSCALLTVGGIYSATRMPSGVYPEVTFPRIAVVAKVPDRDVANMEANVTRKLEEAVSGVLGVAQVRSKTIRGGSEISIDFNPGTDMVRAEQLVWNRIGSRRSDLPPNTELTVEQMTPSVFPIQSVVLTGGDSPAQLRDFAVYDLAPRLKTVPDVLYANVAGGDVREVEVICRPDDLLAHGLSAADLADQIGQLTPFQPVGVVEGQPAAFQIIVDTLPKRAAEIENLIISTRRDQPVRVRDVADVRVLHKDRTMSIGFQQKDAVVITVFRRLGGNTVQVSRDVTALLEERGLTKPTDDPNKKPPRNIRATVVYDQAAFVRSAVDNVRDAILLGSLFSVLILFAFLRSWRATLISALAIPTTLAITFLFLNWTGATLNLMSLGGLAVAIGLIIDDTVVVIENIARHLSPGVKGQGSGVRSQGSGVSSGAKVDANGQPGSSLTPDSRPLTPDSCPLTPDPVDAASGEITGAVVGSTLTTVLVFVPLAFIVGVYGQFFAALSWSLSIAVLVSMVISLTLVPVFAAKFLAGRPMPAPGRVYRAVARAYDFVLARALRAPWVVVGASLAAVVVGVLLYTGVPNPVAKREPGKPPPGPLVKGLETGLMPKMDEGSFIVDYWAPAGSPLAETERKAREIEKILSANPDVDTYVRRTGSENGLFATQTSRGDIAVVLRPAEEDPVSLLTRPVRPPREQLERELKAQGKTVEGERDNIRQKYRRRGLKQVMDEVEDEIKDAFSEHQLKIELIQIMEDELSDLSGANKPIEVKLFGPDQAQLRKLAEEVGEMLEAKGKGRGIKEVNTNVRAGNPDLLVRLDGFYADKMGLKPDAVVRQLKAIFQGQVATQIPESSLRMTDVRVRYPDEIRFGADPAAAGKGYFDVERVRGQWILLPDTKVPVATGGPFAGLPAGPMRAVPVAGLGEVRAVRTPDEQFRENQQPAIFVTAELDEDEAGLGSVVSDVRGWMGNLALPPGYRWEIGGHYLQMREAFRSLLVVMVVAVLLVFILLAFQFQSVVLPLLIFLTQPLSLVSGLVALWVTGTPLNVSSYMGAILLVGLDMKNGILLVEYIQQLRREGMPLREAILLAGHTRFRPILMTSLAAVLGLFPLALGIGPGAQMQQPLAIMVIGGLTANMLFTRLVIPAGYLILERRKERRAAAPAVVPEAVSQPAPATATASVPASPPLTRGARQVIHTWRTRMKLSFAVAAVIALLASTAPAAELELVQTIPLKGKPGGLDHLALDAKRDRLLVANKTNNTLDVVDLKTGGLLKQVPNQTGVQGLAYAADVDRVFVGLGTNGLCNVLAGDSYKAVKTIKFADDCDNVRYNPKTQLVYVAHAEQSLGVISAKTNALKADIKLPAAAEAFVLEAGRPRAYVAAPSPCQVIVIDTDKNEVAATYPVRAAGGAHPIALDEAAHRIYLGCRKEPKVVILDTESGKEVGEVAIPGDVDDLFLDAARKRLYASCGEGFLAVLKVTDADHVEVVEKVPTAKGAKTCLYVAESAKLYLAVPRQEGKDGPEVRVYQAK